MVDGLNELKNELNLIENALLSGDIPLAESKLNSLNIPSNCTDEKRKANLLEIRVLLYKSDFETALRRLTVLMKSKQFKKGSDAWIENYLTRAYINQSLGHSKKAEKDLERLCKSDLNSEYYQDVIFNLATLNRDYGNFSVAEEYYKQVVNNDDSTPEIITRSSLAIAKTRSDMDQPDLTEFTCYVRETAPQWGGWKEFKIAEILESLDLFRSGLYGQGLKELFKHVHETDESAYTESRIRSRIAIAEALIDLGDYNAAKRFLEEVGDILISIQHSSLKFLQLYTELLWSKADIREVFDEDKLWEALDRLEILLAVIAKYPRPPGPSPFWLLIGEIQEKLGQEEQAVRSYTKSMQEAEKIKSYSVAVEAGILLAALEWNSLEKDMKHHGTDRNRILAQTTHLLELLSNQNRPENEWRVHYLRGKIYFESGEHYPGREEMKTAAKIAGSTLFSLGDPALQKTYRQTDIRLEAFTDLQEYFDPENQELMMPANNKVISSGLAAKKDIEIENRQLQSVLSALYEIHSSESIESMIDIMMNWCLQILSADRAKLIIFGKYSKDPEQYYKFRSDSKLSVSFEIPDLWIKEVSKGRGVFTYIRSVDETNSDQRHCVIAAMKKRSITQGIIYLDRKTTDGVFSAVEIRILKTLTSVASIALSSLAIRSRQAELSDQFRKEIIPDFPGIIGESSSIKDVFIQMQRVAPANIPILIQGETGTGKDLIARTIHEISKRSESPFVHLDCSAIPEALLESELFGIAEGIATGVESRIGLMEYADGGTILLDEVGDIPLSTQAKLLRVLQEREFEPVGSDRIVKVDIRVVSTTSRDLKKLIEKGEMREDFYYRLSGVTIKIPPLRDRPGDVLLMARTFLQKYNCDFKKSVKGFTSKLLDAMAGYDWPGNVRELDHLIRKAVLFSEEARLSLSDMELPLVEGEELTLQMAIDFMEKEAITEALQLADKNLEVVADVLDVSLKELNRLMNKSSFIEPVRKI